MASLKQLFEELKTMHQGSPVLLHSRNIKAIEKSGHWPISLHGGGFSFKGYIHVSSERIQYHMEAVPFAGFKNVEPNYGYTQIGKEGDYVTVFLRPEHMQGVQIEGFSFDKRSGCYKGRVSCGDVEMGSLGEKEITFDKCLQYTLEVGEKEKDLHNKYNLRQNLQNMETLTEELITLHERYTAKFQELSEEEKSSPTGKQFKKRLESLERTISDCTKKRDRLEKNNVSSALKEEHEKAGKPFEITSEEEKRTAETAEIELD